MDDEERDINAIFEDIAFTEDRLHRQSYDEGLHAGQAEGHLDGYRLGYTKGIQLGEELGNIYGTVVACQQQQHQSERHRKLLMQLRQAIEAFPRNNDPDADIIGTIENIRLLYKRVQVTLLKSPTTKKGKSVTESETGQQQ